jgi:hypothetical protein
MAKGISINFLADVRDFLRGTKNVEEELDDVADSLDDVARDGDKATEKLEGSFKDLARQAKASGDDIEKGLGGGFDNTSRLGGEAATEIKDEFKSNLSEVTSSFDGSVESMGDLVQGTLGGLVSSLGPLGMAVGAAGALGVGVLIAEITKAAEEAEASKARIREMGLAIIESGADVAGLENFNEQLKLIITNADEAPKKLEDIKNLAKDFPSLADDVGLMATAFAGNADAIEGSLDVLNELIKAEEARTGQGYEGAVAVNEALYDNKEALLQIQAETEAAAQIEADWLASGGAESLAKADAISQINAAYDEAVYAVDNFKNAETGIYDLEAYAASIEERERLLMEYQTSLAESGLTTEQKAALNEMGVEQANAILNGLKDPNVSENTKKTIKDGLKTASKEGSGVAEEEIKKAFQKPIDAKVDVKADTATAQRDLDNLIKARTAIIKVDFQDRYGKRVY